MAAHKKSTWLVFGIITGFTLGFTYFAIGVYSHSPHRYSPSVSHIDSNYDPAGITR